jgi:hypothetical protein
MNTDKNGRGLIEALSLNITGGIEDDHESLRNR